MSSHREGIFVEGLWIEKGSSSGVSVEEVGATSAPLLSAAYHLGSYCQPFNEDFMLCKRENNDPKACLKEGRKVTRCSIDL
jgi:NADH dehydrogenase (ubiquinone) 1 alpha subcomplex subunit 8